MRAVQFVLVFALLLVADSIAFAQADKKARKEAVTQRAKQREYDKRIAKEWEAFTARFVNRQVVPVYSGAYQVGTRVVVTPNYPAIRAYQNELDRIAWNSMTDQQKRDVALFTIARNTGVIAANTGLIADNTAEIARENARIANGVEDIAHEMRREAIQREIDRLFPMR